MLNNIAIIETLKFKDKGHLKCFDQYQIAKRIHTINYPDCPIKAPYLKIKQQKDIRHNLLSDIKRYYTKTFLEAEKTYEMICCDNRVVIQQILQTKSIEQYSLKLVHQDIE